MNIVLRIFHVLLIEGQQREDEDYWREETYTFNTDTKTVTKAEYQFWAPSMAGGYDPPQNFSIEPAMFWTENLSSGIVRQYTHNGSGGFTVSETSQEETPLGLTVQVTPPSAYDSNDGSALVSATGGFTPYSYGLNGIHWQSTNIFQDLAPGDYKAYVRDNNRPASIVSVEFTVPAIDPPAPAPAPAIGVGYFSQNPIDLEITASAPGKRLYLEVWAESSHGLGDYRKLITLEARAGSDSKCLFRKIDVPLDNWLRSLPIELPAPGETEVYRCRRNILSFYVRYAEERTNLGTPGVYSLNAFSTVLLGGLPAAVFPSTDFFGVFHPSAKKFLSWYPDNKKVTREQPEFLYLLVSGAQTLITVQFTSYLANNPVELNNHKEFDLTGSGNGYKLLRIPLEINSLPANIVRFKVRALNGSGAISEVRSYRVEPERGQRRYFLFRNSLGCLDTLRCTGQLEQKLEVATETASRELPQGYTSSFAAQTVWDRSGTQKHKISTGWITRSESEYLQELFLSRDRYQLVGNSWHSIVLATKSIAYAHDDYNRVSQQLEYEFALPANHYAKI